MKKWIKKTLNKEGEAEKVVKVKVKYIMDHMKGYVGVGEVFKAIPVYGGVLIRAGIFRFKLNQGDYEIIDGELQRFETAGKA